MTLFNLLVNLLDLSYDNILKNEKSYKNVLVYEVSYKNLIGAKPLQIRFDKVDGVYDGTRYLVLFGGEKNLK